MSSFYTRVRHGGRGGAHWAQPVVEALCRVGRHPRRLVHVTAQQRERDGREERWEKQKADENGLPL